MLPTTHMHARTLTIPAHIMHARTHNMPSIYSRTRSTSSALSTTRAVRQLRIEPSLTTPAGQQCGWPEVLRQSEWPESHRRSVDRCAVLSDGTSMLTAIYEAFISSSNSVSLGESYGVPGGAATPADRKVRTKFAHIVATSVRSCHAHARARRIFPLPNRMRRWASRGICVQGSHVVVMVDFCSFRIARSYTHNALLAIGWTPSNPRITCYWVDPIRSTHHLHQFCTDRWEAGMDWAEVALRSRTISTRA